MQEILKTPWKKLQEKHGCNKHWHCPMAFSFLLKWLWSSSVSYWILRFIIFRYGKVFKTNILGKPVIVSTDQEVNKVVLQNIGNMFVPAYPQTITEILGESSILKINGSLQKRVHALIGGFLRSPNLKARITPDIESSVKITLNFWKDQPIVYVQDEVKKVSHFLPFHMDYK